MLVPKRAIVGQMRLSSRLRSSFASPPQLAGDCGVWHRTELIAPLFPESERLSTKQKFDSSVSCFNMCQLQAGQCTINRKSTGVMKPSIIAAKAITGTTMATYCTAMALASSGDFS